MYVVYIDRAPVAVFDQKREAVETALAVIAGRADWSLVQVYSQKQEAWIDL